MAAKFAPDRTDDVFAYIVGVVAAHLAKRLAQREKLVASAGWRLNAAIHPGDLGNAKPKSISQITER